MTIHVLKDVLIEKSKLDCYFDHSVPVNLWRALKTNSNVGVFDFIEKPIVLSNGRPRVADIKIENINGVEWVKVKDRPRGVSTFDKPGVPRGKNWQYYKIPKGTRLPMGLAIVKDNYNNDVDATHYTIAPAHDMTLDQFKEKLTILARKIVREAS